VIGGTASLIQPVISASPRGWPRRPAHRHFRGLLSVQSR